MEREKRLLAGLALAQKIKIQKFKNCNGHFFCFFISPNQHTPNTLLDLFLCSHPILFLWLLQTLAFLYAYVLFVVVVCGVCFSGSV